MGTRDALSLDLVSRYTSAEDRKRLMELLRRVFGEGVSVKGLDPKGNPEMLSAHKAKKMLLENRAQGHRLTAKQKRYFGWVAGGRK